MGLKLVASSCLPGFLVEQASYRGSPSGKGSKTMGQNWGDTRPVSAQREALLDTTRLRKGLSLHSAGWLRGPGSGFTPWRGLPVSVGSGRLQCKVFDAGKLTMRSIGHKKGGEVSLTAYAFDQPDLVEAVHPYDRGYGPISRKSHQAANANHPTGLQSKRGQERSWSAALKDDVGAHYGQVVPGHWQSKLDHCLSFQCWYGSTVHRRSVGPEGVHRLCSKFWQDLGGSPSAARSTAVGWLRSSKNVLFPLLGVVMRQGLHLRWRLPFATLWPSLAPTQLRGDCRAPLPTCIALVHPLYVQLFHLFFLAQVARSSCFSSSVLFT